MPETATKYYISGLIFKAAHNAQGHDEVCYAGSPEFRNPDGSLQREAQRMLVAEFGVYGGEFTYRDPLTEMTETGSEFRGGWFDLDGQAEQKGWEAFEKEIVARHMIRMADSGKAKFTLYSAPKAVAPWPTYDETPHGKIAEFAVMAGLVGEALAYEEQNKKRKSVVEALRASLTSPEPEAESQVDDAELTAV